MNMENTCLVWVQPVEVNSNTMHYILCRVCQTQAVQTGMIDSLQLPPAAPQVAWSCQVVRIPNRETRRYTGVHRMPLICL